MTREQYFQNVEVTKGNHYCMFCDNYAKFIIKDNNAVPKIVYPMCEKCATMFKSKIKIGLEMED